MSPTTDRPIFFISDLHLGAKSDLARSDREEQFLHFLETKAPEASQLLILGDLFEFWMEYRHFIPKAHVPVLAALKQLSKKGTTVHYIAGNHDFALGNYFSQYLDIRVHHSPLLLKINNFKFWIHHGDGMAQSDWKYRLARKIIDHPINQFLFRQLHPDWGMALATWVGKSSRDRHGYRPRKLPEYEQAAKKIFEQGYDVVMHGHTHALRVIKFEKGIYINTGEWLRKLQYVELRGQEFKLMEWES